MIDKPLGPSSAQVVGRVKRLLQLPKGYKIGHGGTLDPLASGVLPIAVGEATKTVGYILDATKTYEFTLQWGQQTTTDDSAGEVIATSAICPTAAAVQAVLPQFTGVIEQTPPAFSALKIDGQRAYALARQGHTPAMASKTRHVTVSALTLTATTATTATLRATVSKGTYIRALGRDLALALGTVGHISALRRCQAGPFHLGQAQTLEGLDKSLKTGHSPATLWPQVGLEVAVALADIPVYCGSDPELTALQHGVLPPCPPGLSPGLCQVRNAAGQLGSVMMVTAPGQWAVVRNFNLISTKDR